MPQPHPTYGGFCCHCNKQHSLPSAPALEDARRLIDRLESCKTILKNQAKFSTDHLFSTARGQMFGVMIANDEHGKTHVLKAFSGQYNGYYEVEGWVPPVFNVAQFQRINSPGEKEIKALSKQFAQTEIPAQKQAIKQQRRSCSRILMKKIHALYLLKNFRGAVQPMTDFFPQHKGMPTGAGDCCGPKLIQYAVNHNLTPLGMAEFYFGKENRSKTRKHRRFYPSCTANCAPILGFMLCGL